MKYMKKKTAITTISILSVLAVGLGVFAYITAQQSAEKERYISANYRHAFEELVSGVSDLDSSLKKSVLVTSPSLAGAVCTEVFGKSQTADMALSVLPFSATELEKTGAFINKVGDYAFALSRKAALGESFSEEERENLRALSKTATRLSQCLNDIQQSLGSGLVDVEQYERTIKSFDKQESQVVPETIGDAMSLSESEFPEIPALIYDGPFSEHLLEVSPRLLEGLEEIDQNKGRKLAAQFLGLRPEQVYPSGEINGSIPSLCYAAEFDGIPISLCISRNGGVVYDMLSSKRVESVQLSAEEGLQKAKKHLERRGYKDMRESYYMIRDNVLTANFAYVQDGVVCYSDLIKVGVALDDGSLQSFEASDYVKAHIQRQLPQIQVDAQTASAKVPPELEVLGTETVLIPSAGKYELLCHEFECQDSEGLRYLIYVNAVTGEQEKIMLVLQDENGVLTI